MCYQKLKWHIWMTICVWLEPNVLFRSPSGGCFGGSGSRGFFFKSNGRNCFPSVLFSKLYDKNVRTPFSNPSAAVSVQRFSAPDHKLSMLFIFCIIPVFVYGYVFVFALPDSYIAKSSSLPGYGRNGLNRVSRHDYWLCVFVCVMERE